MSIVVVRGGLVVKDVISMDVGRGGLDFVRLRAWAGGSFGSSSEGDG